METNEGTVRRAKGNRKGGERGEEIARKDWADADALSKYPPHKRAEWLLKMSPFGRWRVVSLPISMARNQLRRPRGARVGCVARRRRPTRRERLARARNEPPRQLGPRRRPRIHLLSPRSNCGGPHVTKGNSKACKRDLRE